MLDWRNLRRLSRSDAQRPKQDIQHLFKARYRGLRRVLQNTVFAESKHDLHHLQTWNCRHGWQDHNRINRLLEFAKPDQLCQGAVRRKLVFFYRRVRILEFEATCRTIDQFLQRELQRHRRGHQMPVVATSGCNILQMWTWSWNVVGRHDGHH